MAILFDDDPAGAVLEYALLMSQYGFVKPVERTEWSNINKAEMGIHEWNGWVERPVLEYLLTKTRNKAEIRKQLNRIFRIFENKDLIEPDPVDDNPRTGHRVITELGIELFHTGKYLEFIHGPKYIAEKWSLSVAKIYKQNEKGIGTGFLINESQIATAKHVIEREGLIIEFEDGTKRNALKPIIPTKNQDLDIAIVPFTEPIESIKPFSLRPTCDLFEEVITIGYPKIPQSDDAYQVFNRGEICSIVTLYRNEIQVYIISSMLRGGFSGAPVINERGEVVGVITENLFDKMQDKEKDLIQGLGYSAAIGSQWLIELKDRRV